MRRESKNLLRWAVGLGLALVAIAGLAGCGRPKTAPPTASDIAISEDAAAPAEPPIGP